ncbi:IS1634 family transposase [Methanomicrobium antiquum]|uniref:IS1634 family transposase n=1 Tax=Methanomicrobium antiquum TaxID=487686 RepID=A0AAF0FTV0_9EURY|nr:IS1634 family transposase [Methanomicrobium antiquum]WFN37836.1 IS1634 family transposase [Methanomicrobium antiquum]
MPFIDGFDDESILSVGHLGIVAGAYDSLGIANIIDNAIPKTRNHNLTHSQAVKAMVINGLGFIERRLYLFPEFFDDIAVERLFGEGISREQINDDVLGRTLDAIAEYGPTELFNDIVANCLIPTEYGSHCIHVDTTNFSVTGEYESDFNTEGIQITYGHPKDGRWDLKRFVLGMASNQHGVPLFLQTFSGNESDKETLRIIIEKLQNSLKSGEKIYHVADAAFYTEKNLQTLGQHTFWISRVPVIIKEAKELVKSDCQFIPCDDNRYSYSESFSEYAGIRQKWVMYHSKPMHEQQSKTFDKNLVKELEKAKTSLRKVCAQEYACEPDARIAAEKWLEKNHKYQFSELEILMIQRKEEKKRGRPKAGEPLVNSYKITADIEYNDSVVEQERQNLGRFVLATNDTEMSADELLRNYKAQGTVERGFRFLKDKSFRVAEVYLKKNSRIQALAMIMVLCLFIYSMTEFRLRKMLVQSGETVTSQTKKQTQRPALKWTFFLFRRVREFSFVEGDKRIKRITNLNDELKKILRLLGGEYEKYYC